MSASRRGPRPPKTKKWVPSFSCGHIKRRASCAVCVAERKPNSRPLAERLWEKVDRSGGPDACWFWTGAVDMGGRAQIYWNGRVQPASRAVVFLETGEEVPPGLHVCHRCDNPKCVNPGHLFLGTPSVNQKDAVAKGRHVSGPHRRTPITEELRAELVRRYQDGESTHKIAAACAVSRRCVAFNLTAAGVYQGMNWKKRAS
jgi:hypothetical protein